MQGWQRLEIDERRWGARTAAAIDTRDPIQEGAVLHLRQTLVQRTGAPVGVIACVCLGNENAPPGVDGKAIEKRAQGVDDFDELVGCGIENVQVSIRNLRMLDDVYDGAE